MCHMKDTALRTIQMIDVSRDLLNCTVFENVTVFIIIYFLFKVDDDVFVNLDAFDMLGDFPELEILESSAESNTSTSTTAAAASTTTATRSNNSDNTGMNHSTPESPSNQGGESIITTSSVEKENEQASTRMDYREGTANITDYSPEWAYPEVCETRCLPCTLSSLI